MEISVPIVVKHVNFKDSTIGTIHFQNIIVPNCPPYVSTDFRTYKRVIERFNANNDTTWPPHPTNEHGRILGSIVLIKSLDNMYLIVRNGNLWGLPKGARNYRSFLHCKEITDKYYYETGNVFIHEAISIDTPETSIDNVIRETLEETGIEINQQYLCTFIADDNYYTAYDRYVYEYQHTVQEYANGFVDRSKYMDSENDVLMWISHEDLQQMVNDQTFNRVKKFNQVSLRFLSNFLN